MKYTALELKTGRELNSHRGQVLLYSLLLTERFIESNNSNILLYLMKKSKTFYIKTIRSELCLLIQRRNELAKLQKIGGEGKSYTLPPILDQDICHKCYVGKICSFYQMAVEEPLKSTPKFDSYRDMRKIADEESLAYFKKWIDIINLEQSAHNINILSQVNSLSLGDKGTIKDQNLVMTNLSIDQESNNLIITLER